MTPEEKRAKERFRKESVPAFVELLEMAQDAIREWGKGQGKEQAWEEIDIKDLMIAANTMIVMANAVTLREGMMRGGAAAAPPGPSVAFQAPDFEPERVVADFNAQLRLRRVDPAVASLVMAQLVSTENGLRMLQIMLGDAVKLRGRKAAPAPGGTGPGHLEMKEEEKHGDEGEEGGGLPGDLRGRPAPSGEGPLPGPEGGEEEP